MFRFSEAWYRYQADQNGIYLPPPVEIVDTTEQDEYLALVNAMSEDFKSGRVPDLLLDDRDIKKPKNFVDFYHGPDGCDETGEPVWKMFPKQIQAATNVLQEHCTNVRGLQCTDLDYVQDIPTHATLDEILSKVTFLEHGVCPRCGGTRLDQWNSGDPKKDLLALAVGQRAGKDATIGFLGGYLHAGYLTLRNLSRAYQLGEGTIFYTTFTATTHAQAKKATYGPFAAVIERHPWFKRYHEMLDYSGQKAGQELYKIGQETIVWPHHGLSVTVEAPDDRNLRGNAKIYGSVTEYAYFYSSTKNAIKINGPQIFDAMNNSFGTIKIGYRKCVEQGLFDMPPYLFPLASSPRTNKDGIMNLYRESKNTPTMYGMHCSTFEFNPDARESDFATNRAANMALYRTSILALPDDAVTGFIKSRRLVSTMPDDEQINAVSCKSVPIVAGSGLQMTSGKIRLRTHASIDATTPKVLGMDMGISYNSCSFVVAHVEFDEDEETGEQIYYTVVDAVFEVIPLPGKRINENRVYNDVVLPVCEALNVKFVVADRWESTQYIDRLADDLDIQGHQYQCKYTDFLTVRSAIDDKRIILPKTELNVGADPLKAVDYVFTIAESGYPYCFNEKPVAHLLYQLLTVEDLAGKTVDKGENSTDDTWRALVLAHRFCHDPEIRETVLSLTANQPVGDGGFEMVAVAFDGRVVDKKSFRPQASAGQTATDPGRESFGVIVPMRPFGYGR